MEIEKEKYKDDKIINLCNEMINIINNIKQEENETNEGSLTEKEYQGLISNIESIIEERLIYLNFWED